MPNDELHGSIVAIAAMQADIRHMSETLTAVHQSLQSMSRELAKIGVLEEKHAMASEAIDRAFTAISVVEKTQKDHEVDAQKKHMAYDKALWYAGGFVTCLVVFWTVFGVYLTTVVRETVEAVAIVKGHIEQDKVKTAEDVMRIIGNPRTDP